MGVSSGGLPEENCVFFAFLSRRKGLRDDFEVAAKYFSWGKLATLLKDTGLRGPDNGCRICPPNPRSFGPHILISCFFPLHPGVPFGRNDVVTVLARRKSCNAPVMRPTRFKTTVAIIAVIMVGLLIVIDTNQGATSA